MGVGDIVFDPQVYGMSVMTQVNTLKSTVNEATMIARQAQQLQNEAQMLLNDAKNLKQNPLQLLGRIQGLWDAYNGVMKDAQGIAFNFQSAQQRFQTMYPTLATPGVQAITAHNATMLDSIHKAMETAVSTQSVYERLCDQLTNNAQALTAAQASQGALQIAQAQAQLEALGNEQLATLTQMTAAKDRVDTEWKAMEAKQQVDAAAGHKLFVGDVGRQGFKRPGQSTPVTLD
jgi:type IV secretion system protein TrbJ